LASLNQVIDGLDDLISKAVKQLVVNSTKNLKESTPIDTGFARSNWVPQIGSPFGGVSGTLGVGSLPNVASDASQVSGLLSVLTGYKSGKVYISNNVTYIQALDSGHSKQEPKGFVLRSLNKAVAKTFIKQ
jgi:hypothetical protein